MCGGQIVTTGKKKKMNGTQMALRFVILYSQNTVILLHSCTEQLVFRPASELPTIDGRVHFYHKLCNQAGNNAVKSLSEGRNYVGAYQKH